MVSGQLPDLLCYRMVDFFMITLTVAMHIALMMIAAREGMDERPGFAIGLMAVLAASLCKLGTVI
jgi:hypothetical protein